MKRALILTYYYPPHNGVAGWRAYSWSRHLHKYNIHPTLVTRHWEGNENKWVDSIKENDHPPVIDQTEDYTIIILPHQHSRLKKIVDKGSIFKIIFFRKIYYLFTILIGRIALEVDGYFLFKKFIKSYLKDHTFDMVIITVPPQNMVRLARYIKRKYKIPVFVDFRDLWDNDELKKNYHPSLNRRVTNILTKFHFKNWLKEITLLSAVSESLAKRVTGLSGHKVVEITNGYEAELFVDTEKKQKIDVFTIAYIGTIYPQVDLSIMISGLNKFISKVGVEKVKLNFIGAESIESVSEKIKQELPKECLYITPRIPKSEAIDYTMKSHVLLHAAFNSYKGIYTGKLFYYLGAKRNILVAPGDKDVIEALIKKSNAGRIANSTDEFYSILMEWYLEYEKTGILSYDGNDEIINNYSREIRQNCLPSSYRLH